MNKRWSQVRAVFDGAAELEGEAREAYLQRACGDDLELLQEVRELLEVDNHEDPLLDVERMARATGLFGDDTAGTGQLVDAYRLVEKLGEGGIRAADRGDRSQS